jgi:hypothetical protein
MTLQSLPIIDLNGGELVLPDDLKRIAAKIGTACH